VLKSECMSNITKTPTNEQRVTELEDVVENMRFDIDALHDKLCDKDSTIDALLEDVELLNRKIISPNMRIFGLNANADEMQAQLKSKVINKMLKIAQPDIDRRNDDMKRVMVIPTQNAHQDNIMIVTFCFDDDKFLVYEGQNLLRAQGIRVGDDLTFKQREHCGHLTNLVKQVTMPKVAWWSRTNRASLRIGIYVVHIPILYSYADEPSVSSNAYPAPISPDVNHASMPHDVIDRGQVAMDQ